MDNICFDFDQLTAVAWPRYARQPAVALRSSNQPGNGAGAGPIRVLSYGALLDLISPHVRLGSFMRFCFSPVICHRYQTWPQQ